MLDTIVREMDGGDRASVIACNHACEMVSEAGFAVGGPTAADQLSTRLAAVEFSGGTYPVEAVRVAKKLFDRRTDASRKTHIVYLTDGVSSIGEQRPGQLADAMRTVLKDTRMSVVNAGGDIDLLAIQAMARAGRGKIFELDPTVSLTAQALDVLNAHYRAVMENPKLSLPEGVVAEARLPDIITAGDEVVIAARFPRALAGEFALAGTVAGQATNKRFPVELTTSKARGNQFVPGEWATQRIQELELDEANHRKEIVDLSVTFGVLSRYTSLLALESDQMMRQYNVEKRERTQWTGEEAAEELVSQQVGRKAQPAKPRRTRMLESEPSPAKRKSSRRASDSVMAMDEDEIGLGGMTSMPMRRPPPRQRKIWVPLVAQATIKAAAKTTRWERKNVQKKLDALAAEPNNRTKRMSAIRAMIRANDVLSARALTQDWIKANPFDPEARLQFAQLNAREASLDEFYEGLIESIDAAPRGRWLQERIMKAAEATHDEPIRCAMEVAMEATAKKPPAKPLDNLACPMTTSVESWFGETRAATPKKAERRSKRGDLVITLDSNRGDWDIMVLEPSGRPIWWGSARKGAVATNVVGNSTERLVIPKMRNGSYSVMAIPRDGQAGDRLKVTVSTFTSTPRRGPRRRGQGVTRPSTRTFEVTTTSAAPVELAEVTKRMQ